MTLTAERGQVLIDAVDGEPGKRALSLACRAARVVASQVREPAPSAGAAVALRRVGDLLASPRPLPAPAGSVA